MLSDFERIARKAHLFTDQDVSLPGVQHPFELRNIFSPIPTIVRELFDNGHYAQATFECLKFLDREVARLANIGETGKVLMMKAFSESNPVLKLTPLTTDTDRSEQEGYKFIYAGVMMALRNPRGHEYAIKDTLENCLDHLAFVSLLLRRLQSAGFTIKE